MHGISAADEIRRMVGSFPQQHGHIRIELVNEQRAFLGRHLFEAIREFPQRLVAYVRVGVGTLVLDWLRCEKSHSRSTGLEYFCQFGLASHIGLEDIFTERLV